MIATLWLGTWHAMRILRLVLGLLAVAAGIVYRNLLIATLGAITFFQGFFKLSCCVATGCAVPLAPRCKTSGETQFKTTKER